MELFELAWTWYESYCPYLFQQDIPWWQQRWNEIMKGEPILSFKEQVKLLLKEWGDDYLAQESSWASAEYWIEYVATRLHERGYRIVKPNTWSFWGASIIDNMEDDWREVIGERLFRKALEHNLAVDQKLFGVNRSIEWFNYSPKRFNCKEK